MDSELFHQLLVGPSAEPAPLVSLSPDQGVSLLQQLDEIVSDAWTFLPRATTIQWPEPGGRVPPNGGYPFDRSFYQVASASGDGHWLCRAWYFGPMGWGVELSRAYQKFPSGFTCPGWDFYRMYFRTEPHMAYGLLAQSILRMQELLRQLEADPKTGGQIDPRPLEKLTRLAHAFMVKPAA